MSGECSLVFYCLTYENMPFKHLQQNPIIVLQLELLGKRKIPEKPSQHKVARTTDLEYDLETEREHEAG